MKLSEIENTAEKNQPDVIEEESDRNIVTILDEAGISYSALRETALSFYVPHPGLETREKAEQLFDREFRYAVSDPNLCLLIYAGLLLEEEGPKGRLPGVSRKSFEKDLSFIIADEVLGETIAGYIAGNKGKFEFVRFDKTKPGILAALGPFMDDVIGGLLGGISANMYSRGIFEMTEAAEKNIRTTEKRD